MWIRESSLDYSHLEPFDYPYQVFTGLGYLSFCQLYNMPANCSSCSSYLISVMFFQFSNGTHVRTYRIVFKGMNWRKNLKLAVSIQTWVFVPLSEMLDISKMNFVKLFHLNVQTVTTAVLVFITDILSWTSQHSRTM